MSKIVSEKQIVDEMLEKIPESPIKQQLREKIEALHFGKVKEVVAGLDNPRNLSVFALKKAGANLGVDKLFESLSTAQKVYTIKENICVKLTMFTIILLFFLSFAFLVFRFFYPDSQIIPF